MSFKFYADQESAVPMFSSGGSLKLKVKLAIVTLCICTSAVRAVAQEKQPLIVPEPAPCVNCTTGGHGSLSNEVAMYARVIEKCIQSKWQPIGGGKDYPSLRVRLRFKNDANLSAEPEIEQRDNSPTFRVLIGAIAGVVKACEPFALPPGRYHAWKDIVVTVRP